MSDRLEEALIKWNAQLALKARKRLARGEARSEAECVTPGTGCPGAPSPERATDVCSSVDDATIVNSLLQEHLRWQGFLSPFQGSDRVRT